MITREAIRAALPLRACVRLALAALLGACQATPVASVLAPLEAAEALPLRFVAASVQAPHYVIAAYGDGCALERDKDGVARMYCSPFVANSEEIAIARVAALAPAL